MSTMESFKSEPQFSPFSPRKPSLFLFFARSCSITLYRTQPIKIELLSYYLTIMVRYRNLVRQIGPSESTVLKNPTFATGVRCFSKIMPKRKYLGFPRRSHFRGEAIFQKTLLPLPCKECLKSFSESGSLKTHLRLIQEKKSFTCKECSK